MTQDQNKVAEEKEQKDEARFHELNAKSDKTDQENTELGELKTNYANTAKDRIGKLTGEKKAERAAREAAEARADKAEKEAQELRDKQAAPSEPAPIVGNENETTDIAGKKYFTDAALSAQIASKKITEAAAIEYQAKRNEEKLTVRVTDNLKQEQTKLTAEKLRTTDAETVLKQYPQFNKTHTDFNADDPLYKMTLELFNDGLGLKPDGLSKSVKRAKQILGIKDTPIDRTSDLSVEDGDAPIRTSEKDKDKEVPFSEQEEDAAESMFCRGDSPNPKTGRPYTRDEAIAAAKEAKKARR